MKYQLFTIIDHGDGIFNDAVVESTTIILRKAKDENLPCIAIREKKGVQIIKHKVDKAIWFSDELYRIVLDISPKSYQLISKIEQHSELFRNSCDIIFGIKPYQVGHGTPQQTQNDVNNRIYHSNSKIDKKWFPLVTGTDVNRYNLAFSGDTFIKYGNWLMYPSDEKKIKEAKLLLRRTSSDLRVAYDDNQFYPQNSLFIITSTKYDLKCLLLLINSKLIDFIYKFKCPQSRKDFC